MWFVKHSKSVLFSVVAFIFGSFCLYQWSSGASFFSRSISPSNGICHILPSGYYLSFSKGSELINAGKYEEALAEAKLLKEKLSNDKTFSNGQDPLVCSGSILYVYNLLRIASLSSHLNLDEEVKAWEELAQGLQGINRNVKEDEAYAFLSQNFTKGEVSLAYYVKQKMSRSK